jgi:hypothetical protein
MAMASASANSAAHVVAMTPGLTINCQSFEHGTKAKSGTIRVLKKKPALLVLKDLEGRKSLTTLLVWACSLGAYFASGMREHS